MHSSFLFYMPKIATVPLCPLKQSVAYRKTILIVCFKKAFCPKIFCQLGIRVNNNNLRCCVDLKQQRYFFSVAYMWFLLTCLSVTSALLKPFKFPMSSCQRILLGKSPSKWAIRLRWHFLVAAELIRDSLVKAWWGPHISQCTDKKYN